MLRVIARMNMGGPAHNVALLSGGLARDRYETLLVTGRLGPGEASLEDLADECGARRLEVPSLGPEPAPVADLGSLRRLAAVVRRFRPDIVHTHTAKAGFLGRMAALSMRPRPLIVHTFHGHVLEGYFGAPRSYLYRVVEKGLGRVSDRLVGVSQSTVDDLVRLGVAPRSKFAVIPIGLDLSGFLQLPPAPDSRFRGEVGVGPDQTLLVYVGRIVPIKRLDVLIRGVAHARKLGADVRLAVVGDGPSRPAAERVAQEAGVSDRVTFVGYRRQLQGVVGGADIGVLASDNEGTPVSLIEMAAGGRPLVATDAGGVRDVVSPSCGLVVPTGDARLLGEAIAELAGDRERRRRLGAAAREHVRPRFSAERLISDVDDLYRAVWVERQRGRG